MNAHDEPLVVLLRDVPFDKLDILSSLHRAVLFADAARRGFIAQLGFVPNKVRGATLAVAVLITIFFSHRLPVDALGGVVIWADERDGRVRFNRTGYRMRLMTKVDLYALVLSAVQCHHQLARAILNDDDDQYEGFAPGEEMDFFRFRAAHLGLLNQLRTWAEHLIETGDYNHGEGVNDDVPTPEELLQTIRGLIDESNRVFTICEVMCA